MAASNLPPPQPFLENPGEPRFTILQWLKSFDNYVLAIEGSNFADDRKRALLIHCLGSEGQRLYYALPSHLSTFEATRTALITFFAPKQNVVAERYKFRSRSQMPGETVDHFVAALREQATKCNFREFESEMIRDQLVEKTSATRVRERLLLEDDLTLDKAISLARHIESAMKESKILTEDSTQISALTTKKCNSDLTSSSAPHLQPVARDILGPAHAARHEPALACSGASAMFVFMLYPVPFLSCC